MVRVAIIGCGLLGVKIAGEFAYHGHRVKCYDNNIQALNSVYQRYQSDKAELINDQIVDSLNFAGFFFFRLKSSNDKIENIRIMELFDNEIKTKQILIVYS